MESPRKGRREEGGLIHRQGLGAQPGAGANLTLRFPSGVSEMTPEEEDCSLRACSLGPSPPLWVSPLPPRREILGALPLTIVLPFVSE